MSTRSCRALEPVGHWQQGHYFIATLGLAEPRRGWLWAGLAISLLYRGSPKGRRPPTWNLTHCGSGHRVCLIEAPAREAFAIADQLAELGDWTFDGLYGWQNASPDLMDKVKALRACLPTYVDFGDGNRDEDAARAVAYARAA